MLGEVGQAVGHEDTHSICGGSGVVVQCVGGYQVLEGMCYGGGNLSKLLEEYNVGFEMLDVVSIMSELLVSRVDSCHNQGGV